MRIRILKILTLPIYGILAITFSSCAMQSNIDSNNADSKIESKADSKAKESTPKSPKGLKYYPQNKDELFNLARDNNIYLGDIDTSKIKDMSYLFANVAKNDCDLIKREYNKAKETSTNSSADENMDHNKILKVIKEMLKACEHPKRKDFSGIESWDTSNVENMESMFLDTESFNQNINSWNVSKVENMKDMFHGAESFNQPLNSWDISKVKVMWRMFDGAKSFNKPLDKWDISKIEIMGYMFYNAKSFNQNLESWGEKLNKESDIDFMFDKSPLESNPPKWYKERNKD